MNEGYNTYPDIYVERLYNAFQGLGGPGCAKPSFQRPAEPFWRIAHKNVETEQKKTSEMCFNGIVFKIRSKRN